MNKKVFLGTIRDDYKEFGGEKIWLTKHEWSCGWYWGLGWIGNRELHTHFDSTFLNGAPTSINEIFKATTLTQEQWWVLRDLFIQAYALKRAAKVYRHGGYQTSKAGITDIIRNKELENKLNKDCETVLNKIWDYLTQK